MSDYVYIRGREKSMLPDYYKHELYHYGVKGMKWGVRKKTYETERNDYRQARKEYKTARKAFRRSAFGMGINAIAKAQKAGNNMLTAELKAIDAKAKYKAAKSKDASKAEFKTYRKEMQKSGLVGSAADVNAGGRSTRMYDHLAETKGKAYADRVQKQVQNVAIAEFATAATVTAGALFVEAYLLNKN